MQAPADFWKALLFLVFALLVVHTDSMIQPRRFVFEHVIPGIVWVALDSQVSFFLVRDQFLPASFVFFGFGVDGGSGAVGSGVMGIRVAGKGCVCFA